jgi:hypothetical protein
MKLFICLTFLCLLQSTTGQGQYNISIARAGKDRIVLYNPNAHSIVVDVADRTYLLSPYRGRELGFALTKSNVENTLFTSYYNIDCYRNDSAQCEANARSAISRQEERVWIESLLALIFQGTNAGIIGDLLRAVFGEDPALISEIMAAYRSNDPDSQKRQRISAIIETYYNRKNKIKENKNNCLYNTQQRLSSYKGSSNFYASQFIHKQENFRFEVTPYYVLGFNAMQYRGVDYKRPGFKTTGASEQLPVGVRASLNFNAYTKYKKRKIDKKFYVVLDYSQSPAIYRKEPDSRLKKDTAYAWNFYGAGIGWETLYRNYKGKYSSSLAFDVGLVTSTNLQYAMDVNKKIVSTIKGSSFKEFNVFASLAFRQKLLSFLDVYGSYKLAASVFTKKAANADRLIPAYRQFQLGLNFTLARAVNYQY